MNLFKLPVNLVLFACILIAPLAGFAQITSNADQVLQTEYSGGAQDKIHVFCGQKNEKNAALTASTANGDSGNFEWQKYNVQTGVFDFFLSDLSGTPTSTVSNLDDGCYRVKITTLSGETTYTAWVFNNYMEELGGITDSDCFSFKLTGTFDTPNLIYTDLTTGQPLNLNKNIQVQWSEGTVVVSHVVTSQIFDPPTKNTNYTFEVSDRFGCTVHTDVQYISIVTKASFDYVLEGQDKKSDPSKTEAPLTVTFTNTSENGDPGQFEWFVFKDLQKIKEEKKAGTFKDSIMANFYSDNLNYTFEESGTYMVKLVSKKVSELTTCTDTFYMKNYIVADSSFIEAPNVFTPDGNGINDKFAIKFFSMKSVKVTILNRWGKVLHVWESNNVRGFYNTAETIPESVWDGKVGGKYASPGVYYYVVEGIGRDGNRRRKAGFFELFRGK